jgi:hypothetical protein
MQERRRHYRTPVFKTAKLFSRAYLGDCVVRDISVGGARLAMLSTRSVPDTFDLSFDSARTLRTCRVVWRTPTEIGLQFQNGSFRSAAA